MNQTRTIGLFGFGCVGQGLWEVLQQSAGLQARIKRICVKDRTKERSIDREYFTFDKADILNDPDIDIIVELIDDAEQAYAIVVEALRKGKSVVSANKKMIAEHFEELRDLQLKHGASLLYEAAVGGSIPIIRSLEEYYDNDLLRSINGIVNGTTNYILSRMQSESMSYQECLQKAQSLGFAESNPFLDVSATDACYKTSILLAHAFGLSVKPENIFHFGIENVQSIDLDVAKHFDCTLKLVAHLSRREDEVIAYVTPRFVKKSSILASADLEFNGILLEAAFSDRQFFHGRGAGSLPTASAVLSDISTLSFNYRYEYKKFYQANRPSFSNDQCIDVYIRFSRQSDLGALEFFSVDTDFAQELNQSSRYLLVRATVNLQSLLEADLSDRKDLFICDASEIDQLSKVQPSAHTDIAHIAKTVKRDAEKHMLAL